MNPPSGSSRGPRSAPVYEFGSKLTRPTGFIIAMWPSCWKWAIGHFGALTGMCVKFGPPRRLIWVSRYEKLRPCSRGSLVKSTPGTMFCVQNATCSVSAKKLSTMRSSTSRAIGRTGSTSSGMSFVGSSTSKSNVSAKASSNTWTPSSHSGKSPLLIAFPEVATVEVGIGAVDLDRLVPQHRLHALLRLPVELHERRLAGGVHEPERVDAEALHEPERPRDGTVGHHPHQHVRRLGHQRHEVPEVVVRRLGLRELAVRLRLDRVDDVGELDRVLDEEDRDVVADDVPVAFLRVQLHGEAAHVAGEIERALAAGDRRETHERRRALTRPLEDVGPREVGQRLVRLEIAVCAVATGVHDTLGDPLVIEVEDLLAEVEVLEQRRPPLADPQRVLVVRDRHALLGGEAAAARSTATWWGSPAFPVRSLAGRFEGFFVVGMRRAVPDRGPVQPLIRRSASRSRARSARPPSIRRRSRVSGRGPSSRRSR